MSDNGRLYVVTRDDAKMLFRAKSNEQLAAFVADLHPRLVDTEDACDCGVEWQALHDALSKRDPGGALPHCILGGRPLYRGDERHVVLVRPDMVGHVATKLQELVADENVVRDVGGVVLDVARLYEHAAQEQAAVIFVTHGS